MKRKNWYVILSKDGATKIHYIHTLVWDHFGDKPRNGRLLHVDHIDGNPSNSCMSNLQLLPLRENISKGKLTKNKTSKSTGVVLDKRRNNKKWLSRIEIDGKSHHLGYFRCETAASIAYQQALFKIKKQENATV